MDNFIEFHVSLFLFTILFLGGGGVGGGTISNVFQEINYKGETFSVALFLPYLYSPDEGQYVWPKHVVENKRRKYRVCVCGVCMDCTAGDQLMPYSEIIAVSSETHTKHLNTLCKRAHTHTHTHNHV
jgi:hypothetical protein